jgi:hypothetical protein
VEPHKQLRLALAAVPDCSSWEVELVRWQLACELLRSGCRSFVALAGIWGWRQQGAAIEGADAAMMRSG